MRSLYSVFFLSLLLSACTSLTPGGSRESDVIARFGQPSDQRQLPDGGRLLDFPGAPLGYENWRVNLGSEGTVRSVEQLLDNLHFARLKPGMTMDNVKRELGLHGESSKYAGISEEVLSWRYMDNGVRMFFNAHFDNLGRFKYSSRTEETMPSNDGGPP